MTKMSRGFVYARNTGSAVRKARKENSAKFLRTVKLTVKRLDDEPRKFGLYRFQVFAEKRKKK